MRVIKTYLGSDGTSLHYDDGGGAKPLIIALAGGAAAHPDYLGDLAGLGDEQRLLVPHLRGVGRSPLPEAVELASYWRQAEDVERLRVALGRDRVLLLAHSAGTRLAISYAARFPRRLVGLVLVTPPAGYLVDAPSDVPELIDRRRGEPAFDAALAAWEAGPERVDDAGFNAWQQRVAPIGYAVWGERARAHASAMHYDYAANRAYFSVEPPDDLAARLRAVSAPVLVIAGAEDCAAGVVAVTAAAKLFPAGDCVVIERCGHFPWVERPAAFRRAVDGFLQPLTATN